STRRQILHALHFQISPYRHCLRYKTHRMLEVEAATFTFGCHMTQLRGALDLAHGGRQDASTPLFQLLRPALPCVAQVKETRRLIHPGPFANQPEVLTLSFIDGTVDGCRQGDEVRLVADAADLLDAELRALPRLPRAVLVSPSSDPFPPLN